MIESKYFKEFREKMGFTNQSLAKSFLSAKDIKPDIDYQYIENLLERLSEIVDKLNSIIHQDICFEDIDNFKTQNIWSVLKTIKENNLIERLNNQGRRPEEVLFSWMRGYIVAQFFKKAVSKIFDINLDEINSIGDDDIYKPEAFKRTPKADYSIQLNNIVLHFEIQSGFQGINDIKQHKVIEARNRLSDIGINSWVIHFDIYNGQVAFVRIDTISDADINWITRQQMEGQTVFNIEQNFFIWKLTDAPPNYTMFINE